MQLYDRDLRTGSPLERRMDGFGYDVALLLAIDLVLFGLVRGVAWLDWRSSHGEPPFWVALPCAVASVGTHVFACWTVFEDRLLLEETPFYVMVSVVSGMPPVVGGIWLLCSSWISGNANNAHGWDVMSKQMKLENDWSRARTMKRNRDVVGALRQYRRYFDENPVCPRPLFEAEFMLETERCYDDALDLLREILRRFGHDDVHWVEAVYRLAHVLEIRFNDFETSHYLLRKVLERCPNSDHAAFARRILAEREARAAAIEVA